MGTAAAIVGGSVLSGVLGDRAGRRQAEASQAGTQATIDEQRRQFDISQEQLAPFREAGINALNQYQQTLGPYQGKLPQLNYQGKIPGYSYQGDVPEFQGGERFNFNLESDPGYNFIKNQALEATSRSMARQGKRNSGNIFAALQDRASGVAAQYAPEAFRQQLMGSQENYGRGISEFDIGRQREQQQYGRGLTSFDIGRQQEANQYNRALTGYGLQAQREQDIYGRGQNYLNRLASMSGVGQTATGQGLAAGQNMANVISSAQQQNALTQGQAIGDRYGAWNNAAQGGISNMMLYNYLQPQTPPPASNMFAGVRPDLGVR